MGKGEKVSSTFSACTRAIVYARLTSDWFEGCGQSLRDSEMTRRFIICLLSIINFCFMLSHGRYWKRFPTGAEWLIEAIVGINAGALGMIPQFSLS